MTASISPQKKKIDRVSLPIASFRRHKQFPDYLPSPGEGEAIYQGEHVCPIADFGLLSGRKGSMSACLEAENAASEEAINEMLAIYQVGISVLLIGYLGGHSFVRLMGLEGRDMSNG